MKISLQELVEGHKTFLDINVDLKLNDANYLGNDISVVSPVRFDGKVVNQNGKIFITGEYSCDIKFLCHRCLKYFINTMQGSIEERLVEDDSKELETDDFYPINKFMFDLGEIIEDALTLSLSIKVICDDNCKGLCSICGTDLNTNQCGCDKDEVDPRLAKLKELL